MYDLFFADNAAWFTVPAFIGTIVFVVRLALAMAGMGDMHLGDLDAHHGDPTEAFKLLSIQTIVGFLMGFGWGGLAALRGAGWDWPACILTGVLVGVGTVWLLVILLKGVHDLQSSGNINTSDTIGIEGDVYANIPAADSGTGRVRLVIGNRQRYFTAASADEPLPTNTRIRVIAANSDNTLTVTRV